MGFLVHKVSRVGWNYTFTPRTPDDYSDCFSSGPQGENDTTADAARAPGDERDPT